MALTTLGQNFARATNDFRMRRLQTDVQDLETTDLFEVGSEVNVANPS